MTEIQKSNDSFRKVLVIEYWNLKFICNLVLRICDFRHKTQRQSHLSLTLSKALNFLRQIIRPNTHFLLPDYPEALQNFLPAQGFRFPEHTPDGQNEAPYGRSVQLNQIKAICFSGYVSKIPNHNTQTPNNIKPGTNKSPVL
jgi:hypothetical protein